MAVLKHPEDLTFSKCNEDDIYLVPDMDLYYKLHPEEEPIIEIEPEITEFIKLLNA